MAEIMKRFLLVDAKNLLWRAESTMGSLSSRGGKPTGGIHGFLSILLRLTEECRPTNVVICWDDWEKGPRVRKSLSADYKKRDPNPSPEREHAQERVMEQAKDLLTFFSMLNVKQARAPEWEADDVMGTLAKRYAERGEVTIFTGDRDLLQCISSKVRVVRPMQDGVFKEETAATVREGFGVSVSQFIDFKALTGDSSDGYKGAPGIGEKSAAKILNTWGDLDSALNAAHTRTQWSDKKLSPRWGEILSSNEAAIQNCRKLATINTDAPLVFVKRDKDFKKAMQLLNKWEMRVLLTQFHKLKQLAWGE